MELLIVFDFCYCGRILGLVKVCTMYRKPTNKVVKMSGLESAMNEYHFKFLMRDMLW